MFNNMWADWICWSSLQWSISLPHYLIVGECQNGVSRPADNRGRHCGMIRGVCIGCSDSSHTKSFNPTLDPTQSPGMMPCHMTAHPWPPPPCYKACVESAVCNVQGFSSFYVHEKLELLQICGSGLCQIKTIRCDVWWLKKPIQSCSIIFSSGLTDLDKFCPVNYNTPYFFIQKGSEDCVISSEQSFYLRRWMFITSSLCHNGVWCWTQTLSCQQWGPTFFCVSTKYHWPK